MEFIHSNCSKIPAPGDKPALRWCPSQVDNYFVNKLLTQSKGFVCVGISLRLAAMRRQAGRFIFGSINSSITLGLHHSASSVVKQKNHPARDGFVSESVFSLRLPPDRRGDLNSRPSRQACRDALTDWYLYKKTLAKQGFFMGRNGEIWTPDLPDRLVGTR